MVVHPIEVVVDADVGVAKVCVVSAIVVNIVWRMANRDGYICTVTDGESGWCYLLFRQRCHHGVAGFTPLGFVAQRSHPVQ